jgi:hypothetical protein
VENVIRWHTVYSQKELEEILEKPISYKEFFEKAPQLNKHRILIKGTICGVRVEEVKDPLMREIRYLDKLIDKLARGKPMDKILRN